MGFRRQSRELAMQILFSIDMSADEPEAVTERFLQNFNPSKKVYGFAVELVHGVLSARPEIDAMIERFSANWKIGRMACVDRNILRFAVYEMLRRPEIPFKVSINEAIDVGKKFGTEESGAFINGILDSVHAVIKRGEIIPDGAPAPARAAEIRHKE